MKQSVHFSLSLILVSVHRNENDNDSSSVGNVLSYYNLLTNISSYGTMGCALTKSIYYNFRLCVLIMLFVLI